MGRTDGRGEAPRLEERSEGEARQSARGGRGVVTPCAGGVRVPGRAGEHATLYVAGNPPAAAGGDREREERERTKERTN